jgi:hypothetical protein
MRAVISMPIETLKTIIARAREFELVDDDELEDDDDDDDDGEDTEAELGDDDDDDDDDDDSPNASADDDDDEDDDEDEDGDEEELEDVLGALKPDELAELLALSWVGEGEYEGTNWAEAVGAARGLPTDDVIVQLAENPMLADSIEHGLTALGYQVAKA